MRSLISSANTNMGKEFSTLTEFQSAFLDKWAELEGSTKAELIRRFVTDKIEWAVSTSYLDHLAEERSKLGVNKTE